MDAKTLSEAFGLITLEELVLLKKVVSTLDTRPVIMNVGTGRGTTLLGILEVRPQAHIITVDIAVTNAKQYLDEAEFGSADVTFVLKDSTQAAEDWKDEEVDLLIIDADHIQEKAAADIAAWVPSVKIGGHVLVHDYGEAWPMWQNVKKVTDAYAATHNLKRQALAGCFAHFIVKPAVVKRRGRPAKKTS